jgi:hypothetical protein
MKIHGLLTVFGFGMFACAAPCVLAEDSVSYASKIAVRTSYASLSNSGTLGGSATLMGSLDLEYLDFLSPELCLAVGYHYDFDFSAGATPLYGFDLGGRYYFSGMGTVVERDLPYMKSEIHDQHAYYFGAEIAQRSFSSGASPATGGSSSSTSSTNPINNVSGSYMDLNLLLGADWRMSRHIDLTGELNYGFMNFAATDQRVKIKGTAIQFGINYVF